MFKIEKEEYINKTFRLEKNMVNEMELLCADRNISMNKLVALCIRYALENLEDPQAPQNPKDKSCQS